MSFFPASIRSRKASLTEEEFDAIVGKVAGEMKAWTPTPTLPQKELTKEELRAENMKL